MNLVTLLENNDNIEAKNLIENALYAKVASVLEDKKIKVIAESYCITEKTVKKHSSKKHGEVSPIGLMTKVAQKFGFKYNGTTQDKASKAHHFQHPTGQKLTIHQTKQGAFYHHSTQNNDIWKMIGNGENHNQLHQHLKQTFPSYHKEHRKAVKEELQAKFGDALIETLSPRPRKNDAAPPGKLGSSRSSGSPDPNARGIGRPDIHISSKEFPVDNTKHTEHPFHSNVISHGYEHEVTMGDKNVSRHQYVHPETGHGVVLTSHGIIHSWHGRNREDNQHIDHYLGDKIHNAPAPKEPPKGLPDTRSHAMFQAPWSNPNSKPIKPPLKEEEENEDPSVKYHKFRNVAIQHGYKQIYGTGKHGPDSFQHSSSGSLPAGTGAGHEVFISKPTEKQMFASHHHKGKGTFHNSPEELHHHLSKIHGTNEEYLGFKKLDKKLSHEKGVYDPAGLAAAIGRKKDGSKGFSTHKHGGDK